MLVFSDRFEKRDNGICGFVGLLFDPGTVVEESFLMYLASVVILTVLIDD